MVGDAEEEDDVWWPLTAAGVVILLELSCQSEPTEWAQL